MSVIVTLCLYDGIVMAADSRTTLTKTYPDGRQDWYVPEIKEKKKTESGYWIHTDVKTDKDGDTIIVVYVGHKDSKEKVQYFIKPEKGQLTSDHKDLDSAKMLSKIEIQLKGRKIIQEYDEE